MSAVLALPNLGVVIGYSGTKCSGLLTSHRPSTSAVLVPLVEKSITRMDSVTCLSIYIYIYIYIYLPLNLVSSKAWITTHQ